MKHAIALLTAALALQATAEVQLLPAGEFTGRTQAPGKGLTWKLTNEQGRALAARLTTRHARTRFNFDYEHQTMMAATNGQPAPASAWASKFEWRDGQGLFAVDTQWTARAKQLIEAGEYAYLSPVIAFDPKSGQVNDVLNAALTNFPDLLDMNPVMQERVARFNASFLPTEIDSMNPILKALLEGLGLPATDATTEAQATVALTSLKTARSDLTAMLKSLGVTETTDVATAITAIAALRAKATTAIAALNATEPDPTKWVSLDKFNQLNTEVAALKASGVNREVDELIAQATADGKCAGVVADVWRDVGKKDIAQLRALIEKTPANPALAGQRQTDKNKPADGGDTLSQEEIAVCNATGIAREDFLKTRKALAAA
jgi:phage I-like protein